MFKKYMLLLVCLIGFTSLNSHAALIFNGSYTTNTDQSLDWLRWDLTNGQSYNDIQSQLGSGGEFEGWRYATSNEAKNFLSSFGLIDYQSFNLAQENSFEAWKQLTDYMGFDHSYYGSPDFNWIYGMVDAEGGTFSQSFNHFYYVNSQDPLKHFTSSFSVDAKMIFLGSFLVRDSVSFSSLSMSTPVAEPTPLILLLIALVMLRLSLLFSRSSLKKDNVTLTA